MSRLIWDADNEKSFEYGVSRGVLYVKMDARDEAAGTDYYPGVVWNGLTNISIEHDGFDSTRLDSSGFVYDILRSPETLSGSIEAYTYPEDFNECDGTKHFTNGGMVGQQEHVPFGLCYRTELAYGAYLIHVIYDCTAILGESDDETVNDTIEAKLFHWDFDTFPYQMDGYSPFSEMLFDSRNIPTDKMVLLENCLYGSGSNDPTLPTPENLLSLVYNGEYVPPSRKDLIRIYPLNASLNGTYDASDNIAYKPVIVDVANQNFSNAVIYEDYHDEYAVDTEGEMLCWLRNPYGSDRKYYKINSELAFGAVFYTGGYTFILLVSMDLNAVSFTTSDGGVLSYSYTMDYLGAGWYISSYEFALPGRCSIVEGVFTFLRPNDKYFDFSVYSEDGDGGYRYAARELLDKALDGFVKYIRAYKLSDVSRPVIKPPEGYSGFAPILLDDGIVKATPLSVFSNGTYNPSSGHAYAPVVVSVPQTEIDSLSISVNGMYTASEGHAYGSVFVNVSGQGSLHADYIGFYDNVSQMPRGVYIQPACSVYGSSSYILLDMTLPSTTTTVSFPDCELIEEDAFFEHPSLMTVSFPSCELVLGYAFYNCSSLVDIYFPVCTSIESYAFEYCTALASVSFPLCSCISDYAFEECHLLSLVYTPNCEYIGGNAFCGCSALSRISLPRCSYVEGNAFASTALLSIWLLSTAVVGIASWASPFEGSPIGYGEGHIYVRPSLVSDYLVDSVWTTYPELTSIITSYYG